MVLRLAGEREVSKEVLPSVRAVQADEQRVGLHEESRASTSFCMLFMKAEESRGGNVRAS